MKIIYKDEPLPYIANNRPERIGQYNYHESRTREDALGYTYSDSANPDQSRNPERSVTECPVLEDEILDWFSEYDDFAEFPEITKAIDKLTVL